LLELYEEEDACLWADANFARAACLLSGV